jgi:hypothetical protein
MVLRGYLSKNRFGILFIMTAILAGIIMKIFKKFHNPYRNDYYFIAGDRIFDSNDSRYWGLLPEDFIVGKVSLIWTSKDLQQCGKFRWDRFFKMCNKC